MTYRDKIRAAYDTLSPSFKLLAEFILDNTYEAAFLNASQLAKRLRVDPATVVRFAQRMAYPGYPELLDEIRTEVQGDLARYALTPNFTAEPASVVVAAIRREINNLELMERSINPNDINRLTEAMLNAHRIILVAEGVSRELASVFAHRLIALGLPALEINVDPGSVAGALKSVGASEVVIGIAADPVCQDVAHVLTLARQRSALTVSISGAMSWPASIEAEMVLASQNDTAIQMPGFATVTVLLSALYQALWIARQDEMVAMNDSYEQVLADLTGLRNAQAMPRTPDMMEDNP